MNSKKSNPSVTDQTLPPTRLYKYEPFNAQSLENLKAQSIHFNSPAHFNDPYDCAVLPIIPVPTDDEVEEVRRLILLDIPLPARDVFFQKSTNELRESFLHIAAKALEDNVKTFDQRGVSCFSEKNDNLLMWSHYGGKYKGFCLEFDTTKTIQNKWLKVNYSDHMPVINLKELLPKPNTEAVLNLLATKSEDWRYENEWRLLHQTSGTLYCYPPECLTGIYFGPEISRQALEIICLIIQGQNKGVKFWRGVRSETEFKVEFVPFTYTSFIEAQQLKA
jgi:Protein of unknown function (DUF2971)